MGWGMWEKLGKGLVFAILFLMAWAGVVIAARLASVGVFTLASVYPDPGMLGIYRFILRLLDWIPMLIWSAFLAWNLAGRWLNRLMEGKRKEVAELPPDEEFERFLDELDKK